MTKLFNSVAAGLGLVWLFAMLSNAASWFTWLSFGLATAFLFAGIINRWGRAARQIADERQGTYEWKGETPLSPMNDRTEAGDNRPTRAA